MKKLQKFYPYILLTVSSCCLIFIISCEKGVFFPIYDRLGTTAH